MSEPETWALLTAQPWQQLAGDHREVLGRVVQLFGPVEGMAIQPVDPISRELVPGAEIFTPWRQIVQIVTVVGTQDDLRRVVGDLSRSPR